MRRDEDWGETREREPRTLRDIRVYEYAENQEDFADRIGVNPATENGWETGRVVPQFRTRHLVADALGLRVNQIIWETPQHRTRQLQKQLKHQASKKRGLAPSSHATPASHQVG